MAFNYLVLHSANAEYDNVTSALLTSLQNVYGPTAQLSIRTASHNVDYKIIKTVLANSERTGSLSIINRSNLGVGIFRHEYFDPDEIGIHEFQLRGFDILGESERGVVGIANRNSFYIRNDRGSFFGANDGKTYGDAFNGMTSNHISHSNGAIMSSGFQSGNVACR